MRVLDEVGPGGGPLKKKAKSEEGRRWYGEDDGEDAGQMGKRQRAGE